MQPRLIFDKTVLVKQLNIVEAHGLMVMRVQKGRDCCVYAFRLSDFENDQNEDQNVIKTKADIKKNKLECSRGLQFELKLNFRIYFLGLGLRWEKIKIIFVDGHCHQVMCLMPVN